jgi:membrane protein required for colicin V production
MNIFDAVVVGAALVAVIAGFRAGLLRSLATIVAYVLATPVAVVMTPKIAPLISAHAAPATQQNVLIFLGVLLAVGLLIGALLRSALNVAAGEDIHVADRAGGALLGALRVALLGVLMVLVFERIIPARHEPGWFSQSQLRPWLAAAGQMGVRSLPPDIVRHIDRLKREHGIATDARASTRR